MTAEPRPTVVDLAYGGLRLSDGRSADVDDLLDAVDSATVEIGGRRVFGDQAWRDVWHHLGLPDRGPEGPVPFVIGHPSTWGRLRTAALARSVAQLGVPVEVIPRAVLIARSHSDGAMQRCAVVETTHLPTVPHDPARTPAETWDVARLRRTAGGWQIEATDVLTPGADDIARQTESIVDDSVEAVFVDGADPAARSRARDVVGAHVVAGRVVDVDRALVRRYGWRTGRHLSEAERFGVHGPTPSVPGPTRGDNRTSRRAVWAAGVVAVLIAVVAVVVGVAQVQPDPAEQTAVVGRTTVVVPADWRRSELDPPDGQNGTQTSRTVFADPDTGRRLLLVQSEVRADSTLASVARSLGNRIRQRGDEVVTEFSPSTRFMGREVISYREAPASGSAIRWYVQVADGLQVSVGCQDGSAGESVDAECARAVSSVRIGPR
ncbi:type VII secretion-associated protein [Gordonia sp. HNM0687]|uniref:Type VII secretion-associated protein n=1 Tax=Gordonia mangrovi TaxID=2665643 RepID=A0A6L7GVE9_9ACTN|nr:type VII secretion-associated protein [Gordonia mangrovi]MXP23021.1 type VII secretion-associated protein [Gordonia mangrovi]UVF77310.1 type VII secretion-associated protein [Gordonia mangrovi]